MKHQLEGYIQLTFERRNERTVASEVYHEGNSRVSSQVVLHSENVPYYFLINSGGGFIEGERYKVDLEIKNDARALLTSQAPTYVYKCDNGLMTTQDGVIDLNENSFLEYITDEVIPFKNSNYRQTTTINMKDTSTLILLDGVTSGWSDDELPFKYANLQLKTTIYMNNRLFYNDHLITEPLYDSMESLGYFEEYLNYNSLVVISPNCTDEIVTAIRKELNMQDFTADFGLSQLEKPGFVMRSLAKTSEENHHVLMYALNLFREKAFGLPELELGKNHR